MRRSLKSAKLIYVSTILSFHNLVESQIGFILRSALITVIIIKKTIKRKIFRSAFHREKEIIERINVSRIA